MTRTKYSASARVNGHEVVQRGVHRNGRVRTYEQCTRCGETAESRASFRAFGCEGGDE